MSKLSSLPARGPLVLLAVLFFSGCATKGDLRDLQTEVRALSARQDSLLMELRAQNLATQDTLRTTSNQLFDIRGQVVQLLRQIQSEQESLREMVREMQRSMVSMRDQIASGRRVGGPGPGGGPVPGAGGVMPGGTATGGSEADPVALYNAAIEQYQRQSYTAARAGFELFLDTYPGDEELAPWALFYLAETMVQQEDPESAVERYQEVRERFPASDAVPQSLYRLGLTYIELDREDDAREALERVMNTWPDSDAATLARVTLAELGGARD